MPLGNRLYREASCGNRWQYLVSIIKGLVSSGLQRDNSGLMQEDLIWSPRSQIVDVDSDVIRLVNADMVIHVLQDC